MRRGHEQTMVAYPETRPQLPENNTTRSQQDPSTYDYHSLLDNGGAQGPFMIHGHRLASALEPIAMTLTRGLHGRADAYLESRLESLPCRRCGVLVGSVYNE